MSIREHFLQSNFQVKDISLTYTVYKKMSAKEFIRQFEVLLFDMDKTIMFGGNRYGDEQDYEKIYKSFGGTKYINSELHDFFYFSYMKLLEKSRDPDFFDAFPTVREFLDADEYFKEFESDEKDLIEKTFAAHECGWVPDNCRKVLNELSKVHKLGLISNVWCESIYFKERLKEEEVYDLFDLLIFSTDHGAIKPSSKLFEIAINHFGMKPNELVYIGDNYKRDVIGAKNVGINSILIQNSPAGDITGDVKPDYVISGIEELV